MVDGYSMRNIGTVTDADGNLKDIYKFNEGAVTYDNLGGVKPLVIGLKLGDDGQLIIDEELTDEAGNIVAYESDVTFEQVKEAYDAKRPIYMDFSKWEDLGGILFNLVPVQQIASFSSLHIQGMAFVWDGIRTAMTASFYAAKSDEGAYSRVSLMLISDSAISYESLPEKPQINNKELASSNNTAEDLDLCRKPLVLRFKLDADGNRIPYEGIEPTAYIVEGATYEELKQAYQSKRPLYLFNNVGSQHSLSYANITAGLIPLTYQVDKMEEHTFFAHGTDGLSGTEGEECVFIGGYTIVGNIMENGEFVIVCYYGSNIATAKYDHLDRKPKINGIELIDNKTSGELGLQSALTSGITIKTINGKNLLGAGNITIEDKTYIYCEVIGDKLFLRGKWKKLKDAGYVPYLFRRGRRHKLNKKNKATEDVTVLTKKGMHLYGRAEFISIIDDGLVRLINKEQTDIGLFDGIKTMIDYQVVYSLDPAAFINAHMSTSAEPASRGKLVVNNGRTEVVATYDENGNVQPIPKRFYWYIGFAAPREYPTQTVRPSEVVSTFAKFFITQKPSLNKGYDYISDGWTFGA